VQERDKFCHELRILEKKIWKLQELARMGTTESQPVSPYDDLEGNEEGPKAGDAELRESILEIKLWAS